MKRFLAPTRWGAVRFAVAVWWGAGCGGPADSATQLDELEQTFESAGPARTEAVEVAPGPAVAPDPGPADSPQAYVNQAVAAVRAGEPAEGVMLLQSLQQRPGMNAQERMAVQRTIRAVTADLVRRAADGDPHAQTELKRIERFLSVR